MIDLNGDYPVLQQALADNASDIHLETGSRPYYRVSGALTAYATIDSTALTLGALASARSRSAAPSPSDADDFAVTYDGRRFRVNYYTTRGRPAAVLRIVPDDLPVLSQLGVPTGFAQLLDRMEGMLLISGAAGDGKTTTLAAALNYLNTNHGGKLITLEDPIERVIESKKLVVHQREYGTDFSDYRNALRAAMRQDPDIIAIGELRDKETFLLAVEATATGHMVIGTTHAATVEKTVSRLLEMTDSPEERSQMRNALAEASVGFLTQRLVPLATGGRKAAFEFAVTDGPLRALIRADRIANITGEIRTSGQRGMQTLDMALARLVRSKEITREMAIKYCVNPDNFSGVLASAL